MSNARAHRAAWLAAIIVVALGFGIALVKVFNDNLVFFYTPTQIAAKEAQRDLGEVNEDPFEGRITDVPLTAICNTIERDLRELLGEGGAQDIDIHQPSLEDLYRHYMDQAQSLQAGEGAA